MTGDMVSCVAAEKLQLSV